MFELLALSPKQNLSSLQGKQKKLKVGVTDQITTITSFVLKSLLWPYFRKICAIRVFGARELARKQDRMNV